MINEVGLKTDFAPAERSSQADIKNQANQFSENLFNMFLSFVPEMILVLNKNRQVVYCNDVVLYKLGLKNASTLVGKRPGEIFNCKNAFVNECGCGTSKFCRYCGAVNAILNTINNKKHSIEECRLLVKAGIAEEALDLRVWTTLFNYKDDDYVFLFISDIADEKRKQFFERIFFHDLLNLASAIKGFSDLANDDQVDSRYRKIYISRISKLSHRIINEIDSHRQLLMAESGEFVVEKTKINSLQFVNSIFNIYNNKEVLNQRILEVDKSAMSFEMVTDERLLCRILANMVKNGLEASVPGETVSISCNMVDDKAYFSVSNPTYIPENIQAQLFNRSFSTKGNGRGLGTYSMKYLTEKYLLGNISYTTSEKDGTTFTVCYPLEI